MRMALPTSSPKMLLGRSVICTETPVMAARLECPWPPYRRSASTMIGWSWLRVNGGACPEGKVESSTSDSATTVKLPE